MPSLYRKAFVCLFVCLCCCNFCVVVVSSCYIISLALLIKLQRLRSLSAITFFCSGVGEISKYILVRQQLVCMLCYNLPFFPSLDHMEIENFKNEFSH